MGQRIRRILIIGIIVGLFTYGCVLSPRPDPLNAGSNRSDGESVSDTSYPQYPDTSEPGPQTGDSGSYPGVDVSQVEDTLMPPGEDMPTSADIGMDQLLDDILEDALTSDVPDSEPEDDLVEEDNAPEETDGELSGDEEEQEIEQ